jgi:hypothetical protein
MPARRTRRLLSILLLSALIVSQSLLTAPTPAAACVPQDVWGYGTSPVWRLGGGALGHSALKGATLYAPSASGLAIWDVSSGGTPTLLGRADLGGPASDVSVEGTRACAVGLFGGMKVVDVSDPATPQVVGVFMPGARGFGVAVKGDTAFASIEGHGFKAADLSDPTHPALMSYVGPPCGFSDFGAVRLAGDHAYVSAKGSGAADGIAFVDIADPHAMDVLGCWTSAARIPAFDIAVDGAVETALVSEAGEGWRVVDFADPGAPVAQDADPSAGTALADVRVAGDRVLFADASSGLSVWSLDVGAPYDRLGYHAGGTAPYVDAAADGDTVVLGDSAGFATLTGVAGAKPLDLTLRNRHTSIPSFPLDSVAMGGYLYSFDRDRGVVAADVSGAEPQVVFSETGLGAEDASIDATGNRLVAGAGTQLRAFALDDPAAPAVLGTATTGAEIAQVRLRGTMAYVAERDGTLEVFDVSGAPVLAHRWAGASLPENPVTQLNAVWVDDGHAYVAAGTPAGGAAIAAAGLAGGMPTGVPSGDQVVVLALDGSSDPTETSRFGTIGTPLSLAGLADKLYIGTTEKLQVADIADPEAAHTIGYLYFGYEVRGVSADPEGGLAWAATPNGLFAVDVSDATRPYAIGNFGGEGFTAMSVRADGRLAVLSAGSQGVVAVAAMSERRA